MEVLSFANFSPRTHGVDAIYDIGATDTESGVVIQMAEAFGHNLTDSPDEQNLGQLISVVGPHKELQRNIQHVKDVIGDDEAGIALARKWVSDSGLLLPVDRSFYAGEAIERPVDVAIITGGVRNWMHRRSEVLLGNSSLTQNALLVGGERVLGLAEGPDVAEGMTEAGYLSEVTKPRLAKKLGSVAAIAAPTKVGDEVMDFAAHQIAESYDLDNTKLAVVSNAAAWVLNAGQMRRALRRIAPNFDEDGQQFGVICDTFPVGTGTEPASTHQNPFSALGQVLRNAQEFTRYAQG